MVGSYLCLRSIVRSCSVASPRLLKRRGFFSSIPRWDDSAESTEAAEMRVRDWISKITSKAHAQEDRIDPYKLQLLDLTLPDFGGTAKLSPRPETGTLVVPGTELTLFPPLIPTDALFPDGTDPSYSSPAPFFRRMWAGGEFAFDQHNQLRVGQDLRCETIVEDVQLKGWERARESGLLDKDIMIFVRQRREVSNEHGLAVVERRTHVYRPELSGSSSSEATRRKQISLHSGGLGCVRVT